MQVDGSTWKVSFQVNASEVLSFIRGLHTDQVSGVLVDRGYVFSPSADLFRAAPGLALVDNDGIVGKERDECVEFACRLGSEVARDDSWGGGGHASSFQRWRGGRRLAMRYTCYTDQCSNTHMTQTEKPLANARDR